MAFLCLCGAEWEEAQAAGSCFLSHFHHVSAATWKRRRAPGMASVRESKGNFRLLCWCGVYFSGSLERTDVLAKHFQCSQPRHVEVFLKPYLE